MTYLESILADAERRHTASLSEAISVKERELRTSLKSELALEFQEKLKSFDVEKEKIKEGFEKQMYELNEQVQRQNAEVAFLKNTVRLECEERMTLLSKLDSYKKKTKSRQPKEEVINDPLPGEPDSSSLLYEKIMMGSSGKRRIRK